MTGRRQQVSGTMDVSECACRGKESASVMNLLMCSLPVSLQDGFFHYREVRRPADTVFGGSEVPPGHAGILSCFHSVHFMFGKSIRR